MKPERKSELPANPSVTKQVIQDAMVSSRKSNITHEVLTNIFHTLKLVNENKKNPGAHTDQINKNISSKMVPSQIARPPTGLFLDPKAVYPLNKAGAFGTLNRECTIVKKGIEQKQGNGAPKFKEIVDFNNRIETQTTKNNEKLEWIKQNKQYPFRIILKDKEKKVKAIYFKTKAQAERIRIYYVNQLQYKGNFKKTMQEAEAKWKSKIADSMRLSMVIFKNDRKSKEVEEARSRKSQGGDKSRTDKSGEKKEKEKQKQPHEQRKSQIKSQKGYSSDMMKMLIDKDKRASNRMSSDSKGKSDVGINLVLKLEDSYKKNLFQSWLKKAHDIQDREKILQPQQWMRNTKTNTLKSKQKINFNQQAQQSSSLSFHTIQLLKQSNLLIKPIISIALYKGQSAQPITESKFNTIIQKKQPYLCYELVIQSGSQAFEVKDKIAQYEIGIKVIDYLSNSDICNERISLKTRVISEKTYLLDDEKTVRLQIGYKSGSGSASQRGVNDEDNPEGAYLEIKGLSPKVIQDIRTHWQSESIKRGYYNTSKDINIIEIFQLSEQTPKFWALGLDQATYKIVSLLASASSILGLKLPQSCLPIIHRLQFLYSEVSELVEVYLSIMVNYMRPYYCLAEFNKINRLHTMLGLEGEVELQAKIGLEMEVMRRIIKIECEDFVDKMNRRGVAYLQLLYQYIYEIHSRNFKMRIMVDIWNFIFKDPTLLPIYMLLLNVWLVKFYVEKLKKCHRCEEVRAVLESHQTCQSETIVRELIILREKYFPISNSSTIIESIKEIFNTRPLQQVIIEFYKRETERLDRKKQNRNIEKNIILQKLSNEVPIQLPKYPHRTYCLHIYFYKLPPVSGSLYIKTNGIEYECINIARTKYFIIADVSTEIRLEFINNRSDEYSCNLTCMQGVNRYTAELQSGKGSQVYKVDYICGLLTEGHIEILKKNRKYEHFIGSFVQQAELFDQFLRPINQCSFLTGLGRRLDKDDLGKKIKVIFSSGSKNFDEIQFYLRWIYICPITLPEKLKLIKQFATNVSKQYFLSNSGCLQKIFVFLFLSMLQFPLSSLQFQSYYSDSLQSEFKAPKIIKCRLNLQNGTSYKLEHIATQYIGNKAHTHLHEDILINELITLIQKQMESVLINVTEAILVLIYSSFGEVRSLEVPVFKKKGGKQMVIDQNKFQFGIEESNDISTAQPEVLVTQILPTFSKISTILDFVNNSKNVQSLGKNREAKSLTESINLLKNCHLKYKKIIMMRYHEYPNKINIPFLDYYHELISEPIPPQIPKNIFLNNLQTDIKTICTFGGILNFSDNKKIQSTVLNKTFGLYGNLRILPNKTDSIYFSSLLPEEEVKTNALLFVNYGYGTFRWEPCTVLGYYYSVKQKQTNLNKQKKPKKNFIVRHGRFEKVFREFQLRMDPHVEQNLPDVQEKSSSPMKNSLKRPGDMTSSKRQLGTISKRNFQEASGRRSQL